jgi:hypothetical protein
VTAGRNSDTSKKLASGKTTKTFFSNIAYENDTFITQFSEENGESKLTSEENLFNNLLH